MPLRMPLFVTRYYMSHNFHNYELHCASRLCCEKFDSPPGHLASLDFLVTAP